MSIENFEDIKNSNELGNNGDDIIALALDKAAENETFRGISLNPRKAERLNTLKQLCQDVAAREHTATAPASLLDNTARHGMAQLRWKSFVYISDERTTELVSRLFALSDAVFMSATDGGDILMSFCVQDMWDEFRYADEK